MQAERWQQIEQLYHAALEREVGQRVAFLAAACAGDEMLRHEVESLLAHEPQVERFIEAPAVEVAAQAIADEQTLLLHRQSLGSYQILSLLGKGGMGEVYRARDTKLDRTVALKLLPPEMTADVERMRRFVREARVAAALNHPNVAHIYEISEADGVNFIAMEYVEGQTLAEKINGQPLATHEIIEIGIQMADALDAAHSKGITHRDIKPANVMLTARGQVKVLDFGLAKLTKTRNAERGTRNAERGTRNENLPDIHRSSFRDHPSTAPGVVMGTVPYMSPEQARGQEVDGRSDIFSLGAVLYEMATGKRPFAGATLTDVLAAILKAEPLPFTHYSLELPVELQRIVSRALRKDREERYQVVKDLLIDLNDLKRELELQVKLEGVATARLPEGVSGAKSADHSINHLMQAEAARSGQTEITRNAAEALESESKRNKWRATFSLRNLVIAVTGITLFSFLSFYVGSKQAPSFSHPSFRQLTFRRGTISTARFAPDGKTLIYSATFDGKPIELFTSRLESPESSSLKFQAGIQAISSTGEMAILLNCQLDWGECHEGTLARVPLVGGTPREIMENVYEADWAPDGKGLAVVRVNEEGEYQLEYPSGTVLYKSPGRISDMRISPKGDQVAFIDHPVLGDISGSVMVVDRTAQKKALSGGWKSVKGLAWSPAGDEVWFSAGKRREIALYAVALTGRERLVFQSPNDLRLCDISPDGRVLATTGTPRSRMISFTAGSEKERDLSWFDWSTSADLSADGKTLLFYEWGMAVGGVPFVYLRKMDGSNDPVQLGQGRALALSPDRKCALLRAEYIGWPNTPGHGRRDGGNLDFP